MAFLFRALTLAAVLFATAAPAAYAQNLIPAEDFARRPKMDRISFSPNGKRFAALEEVKGRMNLVVGDFAGGPLRQVTSYTASDVTNYRWISDERLVFSLVDLQGGLATQRGGGLFAVDADGRNGRQLSPTGQDCMNELRICRSTSFFARVPGSADEIIAVTNERNVSSQDLVKLNTRTGRREVLTDPNPGQVRRYVIDSKLVARAAMTYDRLTTESSFWFRDDDKASWRKVATFAFGAPSFEPLGFDPAGNLFVASNLETGDKMAIHRFDPKTGLPGERIARHPDVDLGMVEDPRGGPPGSPLIFDPETAELIGIDIDGDKPSIAWLEPKLATLQKTIDAALPGRINSIRRLPDEQAFVNSRSGSDPGTYYLYDGKQRALREVARPRSWIDPQRMGRVEAIRYKARDGLEIPAYLTLPAGREAKGLPLVVWVHGGPWARDNYGWDYEAQFMASRGYAVLQPNYRGSTGFGRKHFNASFKQLGQSMQDDVTDGVRKLIADGTVDGSRVCIGGGSYGGYATLMGLVREPALFKCGIDVVGVADLKWWIELGYTDFNQGDARAAEEQLKRLIGDPATDSAMMDANSPRLQAARIKSPLLIIHGAGDQRVPIAHAQAMRDALKANGQEPEWLVFPDEGHGFMRESNRVEYLRRIEAFLAKHIGTKP